MADRTLEVRITGDASSLTRSLGSAQKSAESFGSKIGGTAATATRAFGSAALVAGKVGLAGLAVGLFESVKAAANFQTTMNVLQATTHAGAAKMKEAQAEAIKLGADIHLPATSAKDAAEAMLAMAQGGVKMKDAISAARAAVLLSAAANISNADSGMLVANALNAFHLPGTEAKKVVDDLTGAAIHGGVTMTEMHDALSQAGSASYALRVPIGDVTTAIAELAKGGVKGGMAGAALSIALQRLAKPTTAASKEMKTLNVHAFDAQGNFVGLSKFTQQFTAATEKLTPKQRLQAEATIFGARGMKAAGIIFAGGADTFDNLRDKVTKSGQAQEQANARTKGLAGAFSGLMSTLETVGITLGLKLLPALTEFVRWLTEKIPAAVAAASGALSSIKDAASSMYDWVTKNVGSLRQLTIALGIGVGVVGGLTIAIGLLNIVMSANPVVLLAIAVAALVTGMVLLYERSQQVRDIVNAAFGAMKTAISSALNYVTTTVLPAAIAAWNQYGPKVKAAISGAVSAVKQGIADIEAVILPIASFIQQHWTQIWGVVGPIVKAALQIVKTSVQTTLNAVADVVRGFSDVLHGRWGAAWGELKHLASDVLNGIVSMVGSVLRGLAGTAEGLAKAVGAAIGAGIKTAVKALEGLAGDLWGSVKDAINQVAGQALSLAVTIGTDIKNGAISGIKGLAGMIKDAAEREIKAGLSHLNPFSPVEHGGEIFIGNPIAAGAIKGFANTIAGLGPVMETKLREQIGSLAGVTDKAAKPLVESFKSIVKSSEQAFEDTFKSLNKALDAQFVAGKASIARFKAQLTPTELRIKLAAAAAELSKLSSDVDAAWVAVNALPAAQAAAWSQLLAQQKANMDSLKATLQSTTDDAILSGNTFSKGMAAAASDPLATTLIAAQQTFNTVKAQFDQGLVSQAAFVAAADALEAAKLAASQDSNALTLLDQYNTWQTALQQQATAGAAITTQQATDLTDQASAQTQFQTDSTTAWDTYYQARNALGDHYTEAAATAERTARDNEATALNTALVNRYNRIHTHLENVHETTKRHFDALETMATTTGHNITENLANALGDATDPNSTLTQKLKAVAELIKKYLKTNSPSELGPLSTLDHWMDGFAPAYLKGLDTRAIKAALTEATMPSTGGPPSGSGGAVLARAGDGYGSKVVTQQHITIYQQKGEDTDGLVHRLSYQLTGKG